MRARCLTALALVLAAGPAAAGPTAWVSNERDNTVSVIDVDTLEVVDTIPVGQRPRGLVFSPDYARLYICASDSDAVQVLDVATRRVVTNLPSGADPEFFDLGPDGRYLYIANEDDAITTVVDTAERRVVAQIEVGVEPEGMATSHASEPTLASTSRSTSS
jgi:YVTN family beta-propeller protein